MKVDEDVPYDVKLPSDESGAWTTLCDNWEPTTKELSKEEVCKIADWLRGGLSPEELEAAGCFESQHVLKILGFRFSHRSFFAFQMKNLIAIRRIVLLPFIKTIPYLTSSYTKFREGKAAAEEIWFLKYRAERAVL